MRLAGPNRLNFLLSAFLFLQAAERPTDTRNHRYKRSIQIAEAGPNCAVLDAAVFAHSADAQKDLRLVSGDLTVPFVVTVNEPTQVESEPAEVFNLHEDQESAEFDLAMPNRPYTQLILGLDGRDFVARATVSGADRLDSAQSIPLGMHSVFDMTSQQLSRDTRIPLQESSFRFLHVKLQGKGFRLRGVEVPPSREGQTLFTRVADTRILTQRGGESVASFRVPARVPIERVRLGIGAGYKGDFSRSVRVTAVADALGARKEEVLGTIFRVQRGGISVDEEALPASLGANLQANAKVEVAIGNEGEATLPVSSVALLMRQRTLCFDAFGPVELYYGNPRASAPVEHYEPPERSKMAVLGPEEFNPGFRQWNEKPERRVWSLGRAWTIGLVLLVAGIVAGGLGGSVLPKRRDKLQ